MRMLGSPSAGWNSQERRGKTRGSGETLGEMPRGGRVLPEEQTPSIVGDRNPSSDSPAS
jgi:hypothetical protein